MKSIGYFILFLVLNFGALAIGGLLMGGEVVGEWYQGLNKAPWTPPGWFFGFAWTTIMLAYSWFMAQVVLKNGNRTSVWFVYGLQWILNVAWNPIFFKFHWVLPGIIILILLWFILLYQWKSQTQSLKTTRWLLAPYIVWIAVASSLNAYILWMN